MSIPKFGGGSAVNSPKSGGLSSIEKNINEEETKNRKLNKKLIEKAKQHQPNTMKVGGSSGKKQSSNKKKTVFNFGNIEEQDEEESIRGKSFSKARP